jgi:hypothetical protein
MPDCIYARVLPFPLGVRFPVGHSSACGELLKPLNVSQFLRKDKISTNFSIDVDEKLLAFLSTV